jgi:hypothetical protein
MIAAAPMLGAAVGSMIISNSKLDRLERGVREQTPYDESTGNWKTFQTASVILYSAAGAAAVAGALTYYLGRDREGSGSVSLAPVAWREGIAVCGRFR